MPDPITAGWNWVNSQPWVRPGLLVLTGAASLIKTFCPPNTIAYKIADQVLIYATPLAAGSIGTHVLGVKSGDKDG